MPGSPPSPAARSRTATTARSARRCARRPRRRGSTRPASTCSARCPSCSSPQPVPRGAGARLVARAKRGAAGGHRRGRGGRADQRRRSRRPGEPAHAQVSRAAAAARRSASSSMLIWGFTALHHRPAARARRLGAPLGRRHGPRTAAGAACACGRYGAAMASAMSRHWAVADTVDIVRGDLLDLALLVAGRRVRGLRLPAGLHRWLAELRRLRRRRGARRRVRPGHLACHRRRPDAAGRGRGRPAGQRRDRRASSSRPRSAPTCGRR